MILCLPIYDKHGDFDFEIVNSPFLYGDVPRTTSYGVYISQLLPLARAYINVADSTLAKNFQLRNFSNKGIGKINFTKLFFYFLSPI